MAFSYRTVFRQVALRVNALVGTDTAGIETSYIDTTLTSGTDIDSVIFPYTSIKDALLSAEEEIVACIAGQTDHPYRAFFHNVSGNLANGAVLPTVDGSGQTNPVVGVPGTARDTTDSIVCTAQPLSVIKNIRRNSGSFLISDYYYYNITGNRINHTRTNVILDLCVYNRATQETALTASLANTTGNSVLPDALEFMLMCGSVSRLVRDDEFGSQASIYRNYFESAKSSLLNGNVAVPSAPAGLTTTASGA